MKLKIHLQRSTKRWPSEWHDVEVLPYTFFASQRAIQWLTSRTQEGHTQNRIKIQAIYDEANPEELLSGELPHKDKFERFPREDADYGWVDSAHEYRRSAYIEDEHGPVKTQLVHYAGLGIDKFDDHFEDPLEAILEVAKKLSI